MTERQRCETCGTERPAAILACPACGALVHAGRLRDLARSADALAAAGQFADARDTWHDALALLPPGSTQHRQVRSRVDELTRQIAEAGAPPDVSHTDPARPWWRRGLGAAVAAASLLVGKIKFLALGLLKAKTFFSMLAFFGVYWTAYGWPLALGLALSIYIHEMGHVAMLKQFGIGANAPLFIPGVGALVLLKQHIDDPVVDARIGLAGPLWGLGAGLAAFAVADVTKSQTWGAIAELTGFINLFNLIPIWQLDGSRAFHALSTAERVAIVGAVAVAFAVTGQKLLILVGLVAAFRAIQGATGAGDTRTLATFIGLVAVLSWLSRAVG